MQKRSKCCYVDDEQGEDSACCVCEGRERELKMMQRQVCGWSDAEREYTRGWVV